MIRPRFSVLLVFLITLQGCSLFSNDKPQLKRESTLNSVLTVGMPGLENFSLDPAVAMGGSLEVLETACDSLTSQNVETGGAAPAIAKSWKSGEGGTSITFALNGSVKFSDGTKVSAQAISESLARVVRPETNSPWSGLLSNIEGFEEIRQGSATSLSGIRVLDQETIEIKLSRSQSDLPLVLAHPALIPTAFKDEIPICAGPYEVNVVEGGVDLKKRRSGTKSGYFPSIRVRSFDTSEEAYKAFTDGSIDIAPVPLSMIVEASSRKGYIRAETPELTYLALDTNKPPTSSFRFRRALSFALDRLTVIDAAFGDQRRPATAWSGASEGDTIEACQDVLKRIADPDRAKAELAESGVNPATTGLALYFDAAAVSRLVAQAIQVQLKDALGIGIELVPLDAAGMDASIRDRPKAGLWLLTSTPELPIATFSIAPLFGSGRERNLMGYSNAELDAALESASKADRESERLIGYRRAEGIVCSDMAGIPLWQGVRHWVFDSSKIVFDGHRVDDFGKVELRNAKPV